MASLTLLFIFILITVSKVTSLHCSDQQLPASGDDDLQQVTALHYCWVDNCTIIRLDTGEELDIVYTTDSVLVTTLTNGMLQHFCNKMKYLVPVYSHLVCYVNGVFNSLFGFSVEVIGTCILHSFAYIMFCSETEDKKCWAKYYTVYYMYLTNITIVLLGMVGYDMANNNISGVILPIVVHLHW